MSLCIYLYYNIKIENLQTNEVRECEETVYSSNITHNLTTMASHAGVYEAIWDANDKKVADVIDALKTGLVRLREDPKYFRQFDSPNGFGEYEDLVLFLVKLISFCEEHPLANIEVNK